MNTNNLIWAWRNREEEIEERSPEQTLNLHEYNRVYSVSIPLMITNESLFPGNSGNNLDKTSLFLSAKGRVALTCDSCHSSVSESKGTHCATEPCPFFLMTQKTACVWPLLKFSGLES